jgi:hypothetical protein
MNWYIIVSDILLGTLTRLIIIILLTIMSRQQLILLGTVWQNRHENFQPFRDFWFSLGMVDPAAMHIVLANAAMHLNELRGNETDGATSLAHNAAAIRSVSTRIADNAQNSSDGIMGAILGVCQSMAISIFRLTFNSSFVTMLVVILNSLDI